MDKLERLKGSMIDIIELPLEDGTTLDIELRKPNVAGLAMNGEVPNHLIPTILELLDVKPKKEQQGDEEDIKDLTNIMEIYCRAVMVNPTYDEAMPYLNSEQLDIIMTYAFEGVEKIKKFCKE